MTTLYALLVGIDNYQAVRRLEGCAADVRAAQDYLRTTGTDPKIMTLIDGAATRAGVIGAIRSHLGQAGPGDVALFWFSGHGSEAPAPAWARRFEPTGVVQTLVCADSRHDGTPDLWDKELSVLLDEVAERARHVVVVLDSCHSDGATRDLREREPAARTRVVPAAPPRELESMLPEVLSRAAAPGAEHVVLAACRSFETAQEMPLDSGVRGVFSWSLLSALRRLGPSATYRDLILATRAAVEMRSSRQIPQARPASSALLNQPFLGGAASAPASGVRMRYTRDGWVIDAGAVHGVPATGGIRVGVRGGEPGWEADVAEVRTEDSLVTPVAGWSPPVDRQFPVVVTSIPMPPTTVSFAGKDTAAIDQLRAAITGSPHLRELWPGEPAVPDLRVTVTEDGYLVITDQHDEQLEEHRYAGTYATAGAVSALEHIARWRLIRRLENPVTALADPVHIELVEARPGVALIPDEGRVLTPDESGEYVLSYRPTADGWAAPEVFIRLRNTGPVPLFCVLLDLTSRFKVDPGLFPGEFIAPGATGSCMRGRRVKVFLPPGLPVRPGIRARDRLKLFVAEEQFSPEPYRMPALGRPLGGTPRGFGTRGLIERLGGGAVHRDLGGTELPTGYDWTTAEVTLTTRVP